MTFWLAIVLLALFGLYVFAKVRSYMRESETQWRQVDKSKLKTWEDEDD